MGLNFECQKERREHFAKSTAEKLCCREEICTPLGVSASDGERNSNGEEKRPSGSFFFLISKRYALKKA